MYCVFTAPNCCFKTQIVTSALTEGAPRNALCCVAFPSQTCNLLLCATLKKEKKELHEGVESNYTAPFSNIACQKIVFGEVILVPTLGLI